MSAEPFRHSVHIAAEPERVFPYFTRPEAIVRWMGDHAVLDPRPGGQFTVDINGADTPPRAATSASANLSAAAAFGSLASKRRAAWMASPSSLSTFSAEKLCADRQ